METAITALIVIGVMMLAILGISNRALSAQAAITDASRTLQEREGERARTMLTPTNTIVSDMGDVLQVTVKNSGSTRLADFEHWDVIVEYNNGTGEQVEWLPFGNDPNEWSEQIFQNADASTPEEFEPGILNPGEDLLVNVNLAPTIAPGSVNRITLVTPNGVSTETSFSH